MKNKRVVYTKSMRKYDFRFDKKLFQSFVGKNFEQFRHEKLIYTNTVSLWLEFMIDHRLFTLSNDFENIDFFGWDDEATIFRCVEMKQTDPKIGENIIDRMVQKKIESIILVNDHFYSTHLEEPEYDYWQTSAIIFHFEGYEISFAKQDCWFSLEIEINQGNHLIEKIDDGKDILDDFEQTAEQRLFTEREKIELY